MFFCYFLILFVCGSLRSKFLSCCCYGIVSAESCFPGRVKVREKHEGFRVFVFVYVRVYVPVYVLVYVRVYTRLIACVCVCMCVHTMRLCTLEGSGLGDRAL